MGLSSCPDTSMNQKPRLQLNAGKLKMNKIFVLTFQTLIFQIPFPFRVFDTCIQISIARSSIIHPSFLPFMSAYLHVVTRYVHPIRTKFRFDINNDQSNPLKNDDLKIFSSKISIPCNRYRCIDSFPLSGSD